MRYSLSKWWKAAAPPATFTGSCPIREHTGDGHFVGRCDFATYDHICPRHGVLEDYPDNDDRVVDPQKRKFTR